MTATLKSLEAATQLSNVDTNLYTVPGATATKIESFVLNNPSTTTSYLVTIHKVKSGDAVGTDVIIFGPQYLPPRSGPLELIQRPWPMSTGDFLSGIADVAAKINIHIGGIEVT